jgi:histone H3
MSSELLIPRKPFQVLVIEILHSIVPGLRIQSSAVEALQEAAEAAIVAELEGRNCFIKIRGLRLIYIIVSHHAAVHATRLTITKKDMDFARRIRRDYMGDAIAFTASASKKQL